MNKMTFGTLCLLSVLCGCGPHTIPVSGVVTIDGKPAEDMLVLFQSASPEATVPQAAYGLTNERGEYALSLSEKKKKGVIPGEYAVFISWIDPNPTPDERTSNPCPYQIPDEAARGLLRHTVKAEGTREADFHLTNSKER